MKSWLSLWKLKSPAFFSEVKKEIIPPEKKDDADYGKIKIGGLVISHRLFGKDIEAEKYFHSLENLDEQIMVFIGLLGDFLLEVKFSAQEYSLSYSVRQLCENFFYQYLRQGEESVLYQNQVLVRLVFLFHSAPDNITSLDVLKKLSKELLPNTVLENIIINATPEMKNSGDVGASLWEQIFYYQNEQMPEFYHPMFIEEIEKNLLVPVEQADAEQKLHLIKETETTLSELMDKIEDHNDSLPLAFYWLKTTYFNQYARYGEGSEFYNNYVLSRLVYFITTMDNVHPFEILLRLANELGEDNAFATIIQDVKKKVPAQTEEIGRLIIEAIGEYYK